MAWLEWGPLEGHPRSQSAKHRADVVALPDRCAAAGDDEIALRCGVPQRLRKRFGIVRYRAQRDRDAPRQRDLDGDRRGVAIAHPPRALRGIGPHQLVTRGDDGHAHRAMDGHAVVTQSGEQSRVAAVEHGALNEERLASARVLGGRKDVASRRHGAVDERAIFVEPEQLLLDHGIGPGGNRRTRCDARRATRRQRSGLGVAAIRRSDDAQDGGLAGRGVGDVRGAHGDAVHGGPGEWPAILARDDVASQDAAGGVDEFDIF